MSFQPTSRSSGYDDDPEVNNKGYDPKYLQAFEERKKFLERHARHHRRKSETGSSGHQRSPKLKSGKGVCQFQLVEVEKRRDSDEKVLCISNSLGNVMQNASWQQMQDYGDTTYVVNVIINGCRTGTLTPQELQTFVAAPTKKEKGIVQDNLVKAHSLHAWKAQRHQVRT